MKKGLLSLLALALTVVGCQNYDDQFAELTTLIEGVQSDVDGLSDLQSDVDALAATLNGLSTAVAANASAIAAGNSAAATAAAANATAIGENATAIADGNAAAAAAAASNASAIAANASATAAAAAAAATADAANAGAIAANGGAISSLATGLAALQTQVATIQASLTTVADADDIIALNDELALIQADLDELLAANATINQSITINSLATLEYAESLIGTDTEDADVIINGYVRITTTSLTPAERDRTDVVAAQIATILGNDAGEGLTVTSDDAVTFTKLTFVDADVVINDAAQDLPELRTITGDLETDYAGAQDFSGLTSVSTFTITNNASATSVNLDGVDVDNVIAGGAIGVLTLNNATSVNLGEAAFTQLTANNADSIISTADGTVASLAITATRGGEIRLNQLDEVTGALTITGASTTVLNMIDLDVAGATQITAQDANLPELDHITAATTITATTIDISSVGSITQATDFNTASVSAAGLRNIVAALTHEVGVINYPDANVDGAGEIISSTATNVTVASIDAAADLGGAETRLVLTAQDVSLGAVGSTVTDLTITAADDTDVDFTAGTAALTSVALTGTRSNTITGANIIDVTLTDTSSNVITAAAAALATATLAGTIVSFKSAGTALAELNNTANYLDIPGTTTGETPITFEVINTSAITSIDLSTMNRVAKVVITGNTGLTEVIAPSTSDLLTAGANPSITIKTNSIQATYTAGVAAFPGDGINLPTDYVPHCIYAPGLATWPAYISAISALNSPVTVDIDFDSSDAGNDDHNDELGGDSNSLPGATGSISTEAELARISATPCS